VIYPPLLRMVFQLAQWNRAPQGGGAFTFLSNATDKTIEKALLAGVVYTAVCICVGLFFCCNRRNRTSSSPVSLNPATSRHAGSTPFISMSLNEILIIKGKTDGKLQIMYNSIAPFLTLCEICEFFVFFQVDSEHGESQLNFLLKGIGAFEKGLKEHRVMVSSTTTGKSSMIRQLQAMTHIENDPEVASALKGKIPNIVLLSGSSDSGYTSLQECVDVIKVVLGKL